MKTSRISILVSLFAAIAGPAFAASAGRADDSHLLADIFLVVCGLIILFQLVPVVSLIRNLLNGSVASRGQIATEELKTATSKYR